MEWLPVLIVVLATLGVCFFADKGFTKLFRSSSQHKSGMAVKAGKRYATIGLVVTALGVAALVSVESQGWLMLVAGVVMLLMGIGFGVYFLSFGIYYDDESFIYSSFGKKSKTYVFKDITSQQLYASGASLVIELHLYDGSSIQLQSTMDGVRPFMNKAFDGWRNQHGKTLEECDFYDPERNCWFPNAQEE